MNRLTVIKKWAGFSLVEVIVFVSVMSVALVSFIASVNYSSLLLNDARYKLMATRHSEELAEWITFQREYYGYSTILQKIPNNVSAAYCLNSETVSWPEFSEDCGGTYGLGGFYKRELFLVHSGNEITATISTGWHYLSFTKTVSIVRKFNNYGL